MTHQWDIVGVYFSSSSLCVFASPSPRLFVSFHFRGLVCCRLCVCLLFRLLSSHSIRELSLMVGHICSSWLQVDTPIAFRIDGGLIGPVVWSYPQDIQMILRAALSPEIPENAANALYDVLNVTLKVSEVYYFWTSE